MKNKLWLFVVLAAAMGVYGLAQDVPFDLQAKLMLKILSMDRNLDRYGDPIKIGCSDDAFLSEIGGISGVTIKGKTFKVEKINTLNDIGRYKVIYVGKNWSNNYTAAAAEAVKNKCLVFTQSEDGVLSGGGAVSFKVMDGKPKIVVNLENARNQGTDFPANFLSITMVVGGLQ